MSTKHRTGTPAGWYDDPYNQNQIRYFDGVQWTPQWAPKPVPQIPVQQPRQETPLEPPSTSPSIQEPAPLAVPEPPVPPPPLGPSFPGPGEMPKRRHLGRNIFLAIVGGIVGILVLVGIVSAVGGGSEDLVSQAPQSGNSAPAQPAPEPPPTPNPEGRFSSSADYLLGDFTESPTTGYRFVASARLVNTGNVGLVVRVTAKWFQVGGPPVKSTKIVRVPYGATRRVTFSVDASSDQIDQIQALPYEDETSVRVVMIDYFGKVHG